jgi:4'-phosphopantetheinyl transferase
MACAPALLPAVRACAEPPPGTLLGRLLVRMLLHARGVPSGAMAAALAATPAGKPYIVRSAPDSAYGSADAR